MIDLPRPVADLCAALGADRGVEAVTIGGSRVMGSADASSDWDVGLYCRGRPDLAALARAGLGGLHAWFTRVPASPPLLVEWVSGLRAALSSAS